MAQPSQPSPDQLSNLLAEVDGAKKSPCSSNAVRSGRTRLSQFARTVGLPTRSL